MKTNISNPYWSNCLIEALKQKIRKPHSIVLKPMWNGFHFHIMWYDVDENVVRHFTHKFFKGWHSNLFFKGVVETMSVAKFDAYCLMRKKT